MQVWSSGFYGETINYLDVAYSERSCLVFDHSLLCVVHDYCVRVCDGEFQTATCNIVKLCKETGRMNRFNNCEDAAAECIQTAVRSFLTPAADQMDNTPLFHSNRWKPDLNAIFHSFTTEPKSLLYISFILSVLLPHPLHLIFYTPNPLSLIANRKCEMNPTQSSASPKGSWDFYCKDLIDWCQRGDSPSRSNLSSALAFCVSFSFFHPPSENHKKVVFHLRDSSLAVKQLFKKKLLWFVSKC